MLLPDLCCNLPGSDEAFTCYMVMQHSCCSLYGHARCMLVTCTVMGASDCSLHTDIMLLPPSACLYALPVLPPTQTSPVHFVIACSFYYDHAWFMQALMLFTSQRSLC